MTDANVGTAELDVTANTKPAEQALKRLEGKVGEQTKGLEDFGRKGMLATGLLVTGLGFAGKAASDLNESVNAVSVTYGSSAQGILELGQKAAQSVGLSTSAFNGLAVQFAGFAKQIAGPGGDVVQTVDDMTTRIADFGSVMNVDIPEAAAIFRSALAGETEPIRKFGLDLGAAAVEAYAVEKGIITAGEAMTGAEQVTARYGLLMQQTAQFSGDFANTSDGAANAQRIMTAELQNMAANIGAQVLPPLTALVGGLTDVVGWLGNVNEATNGAIGNLAMFGTAGLGIVSVAARVGASLMKLRDRFTEVGEDGSRSLTKGGKAMIGLGVILTGAAAVYTLYESDKAKAKQTTDEFVAALKAEQEGQEDATDALIARQVAEGVNADLAARAGLSLTDVARVIRGEAVPAWQDLLRVYQGGSSTTEDYVKSQNNVRDAWDLSAVEVIQLHAQVQQYVDGLTTAQTQLANTEQVQRDLTGAVAETGEVFVPINELTMPTAISVTQQYARERAIAAYWEQQYAGEAEASAAAVEEETRATEAQKEATELARRAVEDHIAVLLERNDTIRAAADATFALEDSQADYAKALDGLADREEQAKGNQAELDRIYRDVTRSAADVADATVRVYDEQLKASGQTLTATQRVDLWNQSMIAAAAQASGPTRQSIIDYIAAVNGIPAEQATSIAALIDEGKLDGAQLALDQVSATRTASIQADAEQASLDNVRRALDDLERPRIVRYRAGMPVQYSYAEGTSYHPGGWALVGEEGPELTWLPRGAQVDTAAETRELLRQPIAPAAGARPAELPDTLTLVVEGQPLTARVVAYGRDRSARFDAGRRPG